VVRRRASSCRKAFRLPGTSIGQWDDPNAFARYTGALNVARKRKTPASVGELCDQQLRLAIEISAKAYADHYAQPRPSVSAKVWLHLIHEDAAARDPLIANLVRGGSLPALPRHRGHRVV